MNLQISNSEDIGVRPDLLWVDVDLIKVDASYQREENETHVHSILKNFNWRYFQPVTLAHRPDDSFLVVDGQHRVAAAKMHPAITKIPALIFNSDGEAKDEAMTFVEINGKRKGITPIEKFHAKLAAGDVDALALKNSMDKLDCFVAEYKGHKGPNVTNAVVACTKAVKRCGAKNFEAAIRTLRQTWPNELDVLRSVLVTSLSELYRFNENMDEFHMSTELKKLGMAELFSLTRSLVKLGGGGIKSIAQVLVKTYNKTASKDNQIKEF